MDADLQNRVRPGRARSSRRSVTSRLAAGAAAVALALSVPSAALAQQGGGMGGQDATPVRAPSGMVVSASQIASDVGARILESGGNAVDAAVATGFALAVTHPSAGNIGGGGFMVIRLPDGESTTIDFRERAPLQAFEDMYKGEHGGYSYRKHHDSHLAVGVPGTVAGFAKAHDRYGSGDWARLVDPAVELARDGFTVSEDLAEGLEYLLRRAEGRYPATIAAYSNDGEPYAAGETIRLHDLAESLTRIRDQGRDGFYRGETARLLAEEMRRGGGLITEADLAQYVAMEREPVTTTFHDFTYIGMPPPSSGGTAIAEMLNILEGFDLASMGHGSADYYHLLAESMRRTYRDRAQYLGDQDYVDVPVEWLTSKEHAEQLRGDIDMEKAGRSYADEIYNVAEGEHTTHYSVVDGDGMGVSVTYTLEQGYGSKIVVDGAGFLLNNEMGDFNPMRGVTTRGGLIGTTPNLVEPGKRMLSSMSPSIVARDGELFAVVGSPGGRTIINTVLQVILGVTVFDMNIQEAVNATRMHHQWLPDRIRLEGTASQSAIQDLRDRGHEVESRGRQGTAHSIMVDPETGDRLGAPDPRGEDAGAAGH